MDTDVERYISKFAKTFPDEASCVLYLEKALWRKGIPVSPFDGGEAQRIESHLGLYKCPKTQKVFSVRHGTVFAESRLPLRKWFFAMFLLDVSDSRITPTQIAKYLEVTKPDASLLLQRIRYLRQITYG